METRIGIVTTGGADGADVSVKEIDASTNAATGAVLTAKNISGATVSINDRGVISRDLDNTLSFFFKSSTGAPVDDFKTYITMEDAAFSFIVHLEDSTEGDTMLNTWTGVIDFTILTNASGAFSVTATMKENPNPPSDIGRFWEVSTPDGGSEGDPLGAIGTARSDTVNSWSLTGSVRSATAPADTVPGGW